MSRPKLSALEKNILKYRAFSMVLLLHEVESLKTFIIESIRYTDELSDKKQAARLPNGIKQPFVKACEILVDEGVISCSESQDVRKIVDFRNDVAHAVHKVVADISERSLRREAKPFDYSAVERIRTYHKMMADRMREKFILAIGFQEVAFEQARKTYIEELGRIEKRIEKQRTRHESST